MTLLQLKEINSFYGGIQALKNINIDVNEGEIVTLIGSNGAGKSTTLKTISGQVKPKTGELIYKGENIVKLQSHEIALKGIAHVPEGRRIFSKLTVKENLEMGAFSVKDKKLIKH